jgi:transposase IS166 family protein
VSRGYRPALFRLIIGGRSLSSSGESGAAPWGSDSFLVRTANYAIGDRDGFREIEKLHLIVRQLQRGQFGPRSERLDPDQLQLGLEDLEVRSGLFAGGSEIRTVGPPRAETARGFRGAGADMEACQGASPALHSASLVQPAWIRQLASSADISTMRSSPMVMRRPEKVWTAPIPGGASRRT